MKKAREILAKLISLVFNAIINFHKKYISNLDKPTLYCIFAIVIFGFISLLTVSPAISARIGISKYQLLTKQSIFIALSMFLMIWIANKSSEALIFYSSVFFILFTILVFLVLPIGIEIKGASRWIGAGFLSIQPSEILKPFFVVVNAQILAKNNELEPNKKQIYKSMGITALISSLLILEPDFGMMLLYCFTSAFQMFVAGVKLRFLSAVALILFLFSVATFMLVPHVQQRLLNFSGEETSYQIKKALKSIQEGGFLGKGPGNGDIKYTLPDSHTDFIFSVICEEFGYIFAASLICLYFFVIIRNLMLITFISRLKRDTLIVYGCIFIFMTQVFVNIGVNIRILPNKGMTLPFISYGGSAILGMGILFGIVLCLTKNIYGLKSPYRKIFGPF
ncbi:FtsW/RodA/SpoVE family cell cycle protein [Candidatus Deianiraea vastatrix]|uniref:Probable peptidoglycan glycosyltransferase FtsW n=1 Tax=Candidatus Deianiraea vastatrix TaxID=2163644 RepID=A0A5B8XD71_9RICK|nr:FtsW/RodA/SpoVE family cell cycle protein [Candidatus Deianiraea vastatrix]QED22845.1 Lipid II flippase FtsW [Candidatus Deianiraea vastatrix]